MILSWLVILALIALNALYVAAEFAAVAVQKPQVATLARTGNRRAAALSSVLEDGMQLDRYIAACQIGITLSSLVAGAYGQATIGRALAPVFERAFEFGPTAAQSAAAAVVLLVLTTAQVVLGELVPKSLALQYPAPTALATFPAMRLSTTLFRGFIWLLNGSGFLLLKPFGVIPGGHAHVHSPDEIAILLSESRRGGELTADAHRSLARGLQLSTRTVRHMMTPRQELAVLDVETPPSELLQRIHASAFSWLPVYRGSLDQILGAIHVKDVAAVVAAGGELPPLERLVRPIPFVPQSLHSHALVRFLQQQRSSKAIVVDEHGGVQGIISIDDVLAELFGEIGDELKQPEQLAELLPDGNVRLPGAMRLDEAESWLGTRWQGEAATVGGHIVATLHRLPSEGEQLEIEGVRVTIAEMNPTTVRYVIARPRAADSSAATAAEVS